MITKNRLPNSGFRLGTVNLPVSSFPDLTPVETLRDWFVESNSDGGTPISLAVSQETFPVTQTLPTGEPINYARFNFSSAGSSLGADSFLKLYVRMGILTLNGKYGTFSFWVNTDVLHREIGYTIRRSYGTGGAPSPDDVLGTGVIKFEPGWRRYSVTVPVLPINDGVQIRTPGTNGDGFIEIALFFQAERYVISGIGDKEILPAASNLFDIAQPQFEAGSNATDFEDSVIDVTNFIPPVHGGGSPITVSTAGTTTLVKNGVESLFLINVGAGTGVYSRSLVLSATGARQWDRAIVRLNFVASTNPTIDIKDGVSGLSLIDGGSTGSGSIKLDTIEFFFDGTNWQFLRWT